MMTGSEGVSFRLPQLFFSQQRLSGQVKETEGEGETQKEKSVEGEKQQQIKQEEPSFVWPRPHPHPQGPDCSAPPSAEIQEHTKEA